MTADSFEDIRNAAHNAGYDEFLVIGVDPDGEIQLGGDLSGTRGVRETKLIARALLGIQGMSNFSADELLFRINAELGGLDPDMAEVLEHRTPGDDA